MKKISVIVVIVMLFCITSMNGVSPKKWELRELAQFLKGKFRGISLSYDGILSLAPKEDIMQAPAEDFYLSLLFTSGGIAYLGTGHSGKIYRIDQDGKAELYFQAQEMDVTCMVLGPKGDLFAGTSPNGKVYKITDIGKGTVFFNPRVKYIWDLELIEDGTLLAAVGESGGIYAISNEGQGVSVLKAEENHILCMEKAPNGDIYAGSGGKGRLYRLSRNRKASIVFESAYEEIKDIVLDHKGFIYAAASGSVTQPQKKPAATVQPRTDTEVTITVTPEGVSSPVAPPTGKKQPGALFKINVEGIAKKIWSSGEDMVYSLLWDATEEKIIFGTGNRGRVFVMDKQEKVSLLLQKDSEQIYQLRPQESKIYVLANNPPEVNILHAERRDRGEYLSQVFDAKLVSSWGRIEWDAEIPQGALIQVQTRSGNSNQPSQTWSDWSPPYQKIQGEQILNPKARYLQCRILFRTDSGKTSPTLNRIQLFYLQTNVAPSISKLEMLQVNEVYLEPLSQQERIWGLDTGIAKKAREKQKSREYVIAKKTRRKGYQSIIWEAADANEDALVYSLYIRGRGERTWRILKQNWAEKIFVFETLVFPDGDYLIKLEANDRASNPLDRALKIEKISRPFVIDNSLPRIGNVQAKRERGRLSLSFFTQDAFSRIKSVEVLVRPEEWRAVFPEDGICDSKRENFEVTFPLTENSDNLITIKVTDAHGNVGVHRHVF